MHARRAFTLHGRPVRSGCNRAQGGTSTDLRICEYTALRISRAQFHARQSSCWVGLVIRFDGGVGEGVRCRIGRQLVDLDAVGLRRRLRVAVDRFGNREQIIAGPCRLSVCGHKTIGQSVQAHGPSGEGLLRTPRSRPGVGWPEDPRAVGAVPGGNQVREPVFMAGASWIGILRITSTRGVVRSSNEFRGVLPMDNDTSAMSFPHRGRSATASRRRTGRGGCP